MNKYHHILVPVDFSNGSKRAMERALELNQFYKAKLSVLTIIEPLPAVAYSYMGSAEIEIEVENHTKQQLSAWGQEFGIPAADLYTTTGHTKNEVVETAKKLQCDLIVIGSHGHHGFLSHLLGSTSDAVSHHASCDVLIVRKQGSEE